MAVVELFWALGDPTRLKMVERLSSGGSHTITSLSKELKMTRQGARKHLQILADSNVIVLTPKGRKTVVKLDQRALEKGKKFITKLEQGWEERLKALKDFVVERKKAR